VPVLRNSRHLSSGGGGVAGKKVEPTVEVLEMIISNEQRHVILLPLMMVVNFWSVAMLRQKDLGRHRGLHVFCWGVRADVPDGDC
jgi:hypothetical protein